MIGAAFAAAAPTVPAWQEGFKDGADVGGLISAILAPCGGFGKFIIVIIALSIPSACAPTMYTFSASFIFHFLVTHLMGSTGMSFMAIAPIFARVPRYIFVIITTAMYVTT